MQYTSNEPSSSIERVAMGLGCFSIALGIAEIAAPGSLARLVGVSPSRRSRSVLRSMGAREVATGLAVVSTPGASLPMWGRVAGDAIDLLLLGRNRAPAARFRHTAATAAVVGVAVADLICAMQLGRQRAARGASSVHVRHAVTITRPIEQVYDFWRHLENLPRFMPHLRSVDDIGGGRSHWQTRGPAGTTLRWDAELVTEKENELLAWRSLDGADVENSGSVRFMHAPGGRGTEVHVEMEYRPPAGRLGSAIAMMFGQDPRAQLRTDLRQLKQLLETGEIPQSDAGFWGAARPAAKRPNRTETGVTR